MTIDWSKTATRIAAACAIAALWTLGSYVLVEWAVPDSGVVSVSFAIIQPAAISAFISFLADPAGKRGLGFYLMIPAVSALGMIVISAFVLHEGAICVAMLAPLWIAFGIIGSGLTYRWQKNRRGQVSVGDTFRAHGLLAIPLAIMPLESMLPPPTDYRDISRDVVIDASAEEIWPLIQGIGQLRPGEGQWNFTQDILGLPRPREARLAGSGPGAVRHVQWDRGITFLEVVDVWQPGKRIGWQFDFRNSTNWDMADRHLRPDGPYLHVVSGGYELTRLADGRHLLRLHTRYAATTHFNGYASLWGDLFVGDVENNVLAAIKQRAERL